VSRTRTTLAVLAGIIVASLPFLHYVAPPVTVGPHADHEPWYDGQLGMAGDHHIELVRSGRGTEVYVSDGWRRPVYPTSASLVVDGGQPIALRPDGDRLLTDTQLQGREATVTAILADGSRLAVTFQLAAE
jgi:hypothetical protein